MPDAAFWPVLFDLDGTLTDSAPGILSCVRYALGVVDHPGLPPEVLRKFLGPPLVDSFVDLAGLTPAQAQVALTAYRQAFRDGGMYANSVYPGVGQLLARLREAGVVIGLATSKPEVFAGQILEHFGLLEYFAVVTGAQLDGRRNAKSEVVAEALHRLGQLGALPPQAHPVLVGDREHDVAGARANGLGCIGVGWGYADAGELEGAGALAVVEDAAQLWRLLRGGEDPC